MTHSLSGWLGLPPGAPDTVLDVAGFRYLLLTVAALWVVEVARGRRWAALAVGVLSWTLSLGFWCLALQRPYGVLVEPEATVRAAEIAVAATSGAAGASPVVGEMARFRGWQELATNGPLPAGIAMVLPTVTCLLIVPLLGLAVRLCWGGAEHRWLGAVLILAFPASAVAGVGAGSLLSGLWSRPGTSLVLVLLLIAALLAGRLPLHRALRCALASAALGLWALVPESGAVDPVDAVRALTLDQGLWLLLGGLGLRQHRDPSAIALVGVGCVLTLAASAGAAVDAWGGLAMVRTGLLIASTFPIAGLASRVGEALASRAHRLARLEARYLGLAALLAATLPGSAVIWWDPTALDPVAHASLSPVSESLDACAAWIRAETPDDAVFLASPLYSPELALRTGRRVLRWSDAATPPDEPRRVRAERLLLARRPLPAWVSRFGVRYVFAAPGDFRARRVESPEALANQPGLERLYADQWRFHVYRVVP